MHIPRAASCGLALVLIAAPAAVHVRALERVTPASAAGPIADTIARHGRELARDLENGPADPEWRRVVRLEPGREIALTSRTSGPVIRHFLAATDADVTVLNLTVPTLPAPAVRTLRRLASEHPAALQAITRGGTLLDADLRLAPDGVFFAGARVADLRDVLETVARADVAEIRGWQKGRGFWGHLGPLGGYFVGNMIGGLGLGYTCLAIAGRDHCDTGAFLLGAAVGGVAGAVHGFRAARRETEEIIYRQPGD